MILLYILFILLVFAYGAIEVIRALWAFFRYILESISFYKIAKRRGYEKPGYAWVPIVRLWLMGSFSDHHQQRICGRDTNRRGKLLIFKSIEAVACTIAVPSLMVHALANDWFMALLDRLEQIVSDLPEPPFLMVSLLMLCWWVMRIIRRVLFYAASYDLYADCRKKNPKRKVTLSILCPLLLPFFIFSCRKNNDDMTAMVQEQWRSAPETQEA